MEDAGVTGELRHNRHTVHRRGYRHHCRDAPVLGTNPNDVATGVGDPPQHYAFGIDAGQLPGGGYCRVIILALPRRPHKLAGRPTGRRETAVVEQHQAIRNGTK